MARPLPARMRVAGNVGRHPIEILLNPCRAHRVRIDRAKSPTAQNQEHDRLRQGRHTALRACGSIDGLFAVSPDGEPIWDGSFRRVLIGRKELSLMRKVKSYPLYSMLLSKIAIVL